MARTSRRRIKRTNGSRTRKNRPTNGPKKNHGTDRKILFRDLARFALPHRAEHFFVKHTGVGRSTANRWLSGKSRPSGDAVCALVADILVRLR